MISLSRQTRHVHPYQLPSMENRVNAIVNLTLGLKLEHQQLFLLLIKPFSLVSIWHTHIYVTVGLILIESTIRSHKCSSSVQVPVELQHRRRATMLYHTYYNILRSPLEMFTSIVNFCVKSYSIISWFILISRFKIWDLKTYKHQTQRCNGIFGRVW